MIGGVRLLFVTGKGGVGKTAVAAAVAVLAARCGLRTLVCEVDAKGDLAAALECGPLAFEPTEIGAELHAMVMDTESSLREYLRLHLRVPRFGRIAALARSFDLVATAAPGVREVLTVGKLAYEVREDNYDLVVVDASASGHVVGQLAAPAAIGELVQVGMVRNQIDWMLEMLTDPEIAGTLIVTTPEEMPVVETIELAERLRDETGVALAGVAVNRVLPELFTRAEEEIFAAVASPPARSVLAEAVGTSVGHVLDGADLAVRLRRGRAQHLARLRQALPDGTPTVYVPELFTRLGGMRLTTQIADALAEELE